MSVLRKLDGLGGLPGNGVIASTIVQILTIRREEAQSELPILEVRDLNIINVFSNASTYKRRGDEV